MAYGDKKDIGYAGMKADSGDDRVESYAASGAIQFGRVATANYAAGTVAIGGTGTGITVHTHVTVNPHVKPDGYKDKDNVGIMVFGNIWAAIKTGEAVTAGSKVKFEALTGLIAATGADLKGAIIVAVETLKDGSKIAQVQLNNPATF